MKNFLAIQRFLFPFFTDHRPHISGSFFCKGQAEPFHLESASQAMADVALGRVHSTAEFLQQGFSTRSLACFLSHQDI